MDGDRICVLPDEVLLLILEQCASQFSRVVLKFVCKRWRSLLTPTREAKPRLTRWHYSKKGKATDMWTRYTVAGRSPDNYPSFTTWVATTKLFHFTRMCIRRGYIGLLRWLDGTGVSECSFFPAIASKIVDAIPDEAPFMAAAIYRGTVQTLAWVHKRDRNPYEWAVVQTCSSERLELCKKLLSYKRPCYPVTDGAVFRMVNNNLGDLLVTLMKERGEDRFLMETVLGTCIRKADSTMLTVVLANLCLLPSPLQQIWLHDIKWCDMAAQQGSVATLDALRRYNFAWGPKVMLDAVAVDFECFRYAFESGCPLNTNHLTCYAIRYGVDPIRSLDLIFERYGVWAFPRDIWGELSRMEKDVRPVMEWLLKHNIYGNDTLGAQSVDYMIICKQKESTRWLIEHGFTFTPAALSVMTDAWGWNDLATLYGQYGDKRISMRKRMSSHLAVHRSKRQRCQFY